MSGLKILVPISAVIMVIFGVLLVILKITGTGGGNGVAPTPTPSLTATEMMPNSPTPLGANWKAVTPQAASAIGRGDCPAMWAAYADPGGRFSLCYPPDFAVAANDSDINANSPQLNVAVAWNATSGYGLGPPSDKTCPAYTGIVEGPASSSFVQLTIGGQPAPACLSIGRIQSSFHGYVAFARDGSDKAGFISFAASFIGPDLPALGNEIIKTLTVNFR